MCASRKSWATVLDTLHINGAIYADCSKSERAENLQALSAKTLSERIERADSILIISAYFDRAFLQDLFSKKGVLDNKEIVMIFARPAPPALRDQLADLKRLQKYMRGKGNRGTDVNVQIIAEGNRFLHSKLYSFRRGKWIRTLIGSANATGNGFLRNDEILLEIKGRHIAIDQYIRRARSKSKNCEDDDLSKIEEYSNFQSLLRDGSIYFKPTRSLPYSIDCFDNKPHVTEALKPSIAGNALPFHEGQAFGMLNVLRLVGIGAGSLNPEGNKVERVVLSASAIETSYGYWVPSEYQGELERKLGKVEKKKAAGFVEMGKSLQLLTDVSAMQSLRNNYIDVVNERLRSVGARSLTEEEMKDIETRFLRRVQRLRQALGNQVECNRLAKILEGTPVPEIWEDPQSRNEMIQSFCEYVSWKLDASGRMPRIVGKLKKVFNLVADDEARSVQAKIDRFFLSQRCDREAWK